MSKNGKILLGCGGVLIVVGVVALVVGYFGINYLEMRLEQSAKPDEDAGIAFGKTVNQQGCIDEGLRRSRSMTYLDLITAVLSESLSTRV